MLAGIQWKTCGEKEDYNFNNIGHEVESLFNHELTRMYMDND